ncbi:hypothetical protein EV194_101694 [Natronoflexus pectinivorans]|uniref:Uncharacterized protein n=2 Tax=Natronoflexus pectinivorans TaxID=682526 RepID=A0A4R2GPJ1_9BACT|nr:hypothetical protein EV194_101694 [Natronoflexus pectinivorans]
MIQIAGTMPYRRLPNTDQARLRALKSAVKKGNSLNPIDLAFSQKLLLELKAFLPHFEQVLNQYQYNRERQANTGKQLGEHYKSARLYVSHFFQVVNLCIARGEIKPEARTYYGLAVDEKSVPEIGTEQQLLQWGKSLIKGEEDRMAAGATRIYNPSLAMVRVKFEKFLEYYNIHKDLLATSHKLLDKVNDYREQADKLITTVWNEVEAKNENLSPDERREICSHYGVVYVYRPSEKEHSSV